MTQTLSNASAGKTGRSDNEQGEKNGEHAKVSGSPQRSRGNDTVVKATEKPNSTTEVPIPVVEEKEQVVIPSSTMVSLIDKVAEEPKSENKQSEPKEQQQIEYINVGTSKSKSHDSQSDHGRSSTNSVEQSRDKSGNADGEDEERTATTVKQQGKRKRKVTVKIENPDEGEGLLVTQIFTDDKKTTYMKSTGERFLFDYCKEFETRYKRILNDQHINMGRIRSRIERKGDIGKRLKEAEQKIVKMEKVQEWLVTEIVGLMRNLSWQPPTGRTPITSVAIEEYEEIVGNILSDKERPIPEEVIVINEEEQDGFSDGRNNAFLDEHEEAMGMVASSGVDDPLARLNEVPELVIQSPVRQQQDGGDLERINMTTAQPPSFPSFKDTFSGEKGENIKSFLKRYSAWVRSAKIPEEEMASRLTMQLRGRAAKIIDDLEDEDYDDYEKVKEYLERKFKRNGELDQFTARDALERVDYYKCGSFADFIEAISDLTAIAFPNKRGADLEERIYEAAMRRLPVQFGIELNRRDVKDYEGLMLHGPKEETLRKRGEAAGVRNRQEVYAVHDTVQEGDEDQEQANYAQVKPRAPVRRANTSPQRRNQNPIQQQPQRQPRRDYPVQPIRPRNAPICYVCRQPGHIGRDCPNQGYRGGNVQPIRYQQPRAIMQQPPRNFAQRQNYIPQPNPNRNQMCYNCRKMGHLAFECRSRRSPQQGLPRGNPQGYRREQAPNRQDMQAMADQLANMGIQGRAQYPMAMPAQYVYQQPQMALPMQYAQQPYQQNAIAMIPPAQQSTGEGSTPASQQPIKSMKVVPITTKEPVKETKKVDADHPVSMKEHRDLMKKYEYVAAKMYQKECDENPDPDLIAMITRQDGEPGPRVIPVERRLTVIPIKLNGISLAALYDTGATVTLASRSIADIAGIELVDNDQRVQSVTGHVQCLSKKGMAKLSIGNHTRRVEINVGEDDWLGLNNPYDMIIGVSTMVEFPPMLLDPKNRKLIIHDGVGMEINMKTKGELMREQRKVFAIEEKEIPAHTGVLVAVLVEGSKGKNTSSMTIEATNPKVNFAECLVNVDESNKSTIWIENHSEEPIKVHKRMMVGSALNVIGKEENLTNYPEITMSVREAAGRWKEADPAYKVDYSGCDATTDQKEKLRKLIEKYGDQFSKNGYDLGLANVSPMVIKTTTEIPFKPTIYPIHRGAKDDLQKQIQQMIESGCIIESDTPWVSPIVMVKKKNGELRPCIDLRKLNEVTIPDHFPLPRLADTLDRVAGKAILSSIDLMKGYHQILMEEESSRKCGFITPWGVYQCLKMPFGLKNAPSTFMRVMTKVTEGLEDICIVYMDDFIVMTEKDDFEQHLKDLERVFQRLKEFNIKANPRKCEFARRKLTFLGHIVSKDGIQPDDRNVLKIQNFPIPKNKKEVKRFLGMCSFFRRFIRKYAEIASPLAELTRKDQAWEWKDAHQQSFENLRALLASKPILAFPDDTKPFHLFVDASSHALGVALMQVNGEEEKGKVTSYNYISFYTRQFSRAELKWPIVQKELISMVEGIRWSLYYTYGRKVIVHTDHRPLIHLIRKKTTHTNLARWIIELQQYGEDMLEIRYIQGERNTVADALSRLVPRLEALIEDTNDNELEDLIKGPFCLDVDTHMEKAAAIRKAVEKRNSDPEGEIHYRIEGEKPIQELQMEDPVLLVAKEILKSKVKPDSLDEVTKWYVENCELNSDGVIVYKRKAANGLIPIIIPERLRKELFYQFHTHKLGGGHSCLERTLSKMSRYAWKDKHKEMALWHKECHECQIRAPKRHKIPLVMTELDQVFERMGVDCCGPLSLTSKGVLHYIVAVDMLSKWIVLVAVPDVKAMTVAKAIYEHVILTFGCPKELITDNAKTFTSTNFEEVMKLLGIKKLNCTPYHSDGNAITERPLRECHDMVAKYIAEADKNHKELEWDDVLKEIAWCHNVTPHSTTGMSPFFLMFGREPTFPIDILLEARKGVRKDPNMELFKKHLVQTIEGARKFAVENMKKAMDEVKRQADKRAKASDIAVGELVLYKDTRKRVGMSEKFKNPWFTINRVKAIKGQHAWIAPRDKPDDVPRRVHLNQIKRYYSEEERTVKKELSDTTTRVRKEPRKKAVPIQEKPQEREISRVTRKGMKLRTLIYDDKGRSRPAKKN